MMNEELKQKWIVALRSGDYQQTQGSLHRLRTVGSIKPGHCCLGVLCEVMELPKQDNEGLMEYYYDNIYLRSDIQPVLAEIGMSNTQQSNLINMNDRGASFTDIANYIEGNL